VPLPAQLPAITWRAGLDLSPLDVTSDNDVGEFSGHDQLRGVADVGFHVAFTHATWAWKGSAGGRGCGRLLRTAIVSGDPWVG